MYCLDDVDYLNDKEYFTCKIFTDRDINEILHKYGRYRYVHCVRNLSHSEFKQLIDKADIFDTKHVDLGFDGSYHEGAIVFDKQNSEATLYTTANRLRGFILYDEVKNDVENPDIRDSVANLDADCANPGHDVGAVELLQQICTGELDLRGFDFDYYENYKELSDRNNPKSIMPLEVEYCFPNDGDEYVKCDELTYDVDDLECEIRKADWAGHMISASASLLRSGGDFVSKIRIDGQFCEHIEILFMGTDVLEEVDIKDAALSKVKSMLTMFDDCEIDKIDLTDVAFDNLEEVRDGLVYFCKVREIDFGLNEFPKLKELNNLMVCTTSLETLRCSYGLIKKLIACGVMLNKCKKLDKDTFITKIKGGETKWKTVTVHINRK